MEDMESQGQFGLLKDFNPRLGFVRKVYGILSVQLIFTGAMCALSMQTSFGTFQLNNLALFWVCWAMTLVVMIALFCFLNLARAVPTNYILLAIFTACEAYLVSCVTTLYDPKLVVMAAVMTAAMTCALTFYACTTKTDITMYGGALWIAGCGLFLLTIFGWFFPENGIFNILICIAAICLYGLYLIYDTQLIMGGKKYSLSMDDYIIGALMLYVDIIMLFLRILQLLGAAKK